MKNLIIICILFLTTSCNYHKSDDKPNIEIKATLVRTYDSTDNNSTKHRYFDVKIDLKNNSNKQIIFWLMTCSWYDNFKVNNDYIGICIWECDGNYLHKVSLSPNFSKTFKCSLLKYKNISTKSSNYTKLGLIYIDSHKYSKYDEANEILLCKTKQDSIIWSNPLYLH